MDITTSVALVRIEDDVPVYKYEPIQDAEEIRILTLEPATSFSDPLVAGLFARKILDSDNLRYLWPTYHCVSYCWGTAPLSQWLQCNQQRLRITSTVDEMLRHFRRALTPRNLWIDAICIDQSNDSEKAAQVKNMAAIYERADKVHVWLGSATTSDHIPAIFSILRTLALTTSQLELALDSTLTPLSDSIRSSLVSFLTRAWFMRRWVLQEVQLAHAVTVHCGTHRLSWNWIRDGMGTLHTGYNMAELSHTIMAFISAHAARSLESVQPLRRKIEDCTILELLWDHHLRECSDARDRIFALYGMVSSTRNPGFELSMRCPVNYSNHFALVYTQLAMAAVEAGFGISVLVHAIAFGTLAEQNADFPSWVPRWNQPRRLRKAMLPGRDSILVAGESNPVLMARSQGHTVLRLQGRLYTITAAQSSDPDVGPVSCFRSIQETLPDSTDQAIYGDAATSILIRTLHTASYFRDSKDFDFNSTFSHQRKHYESHSNAHLDQFKMSCIKLALKQELRVIDKIHTERDFHYSSMRLDQAFNRILPEHSVFCYEFEGRAAPGIAFADVEPGDCVLRLLDLPSRERQPTTLIVRPCKSNARDRIASTSLFRLVGCCLDSYSWPEIFHSRGRLDALQSFVKLAPVQHTHVDIV